jgi:hypothetical protein
VTRRRKSAATVATFRNDPLFPRIEQVVGTILKTSKVVTPIDVLVGMQLLTHDDVTPRTRRLPRTRDQLQSHAFVAAAAHSSL